VISNRRPQFVAELTKLTKELNKMLETVDGVLLTNRWTDRTNEPRVRTVLKVFYGI